LGSPRLIPLLRGPPRSASFWTTSGKSPDPGFLACPIRVHTHRASPRSVRSMRVCPCKEKAANRGRLAASRFLRLGFPAWEADALPTELFPRRGG
jgi:hypothetical protein